MIFVLLFYRQTKFMRQNARDIYDLGNHRSAMWFSTLLTFGTCFIIVNLIKFKINFISHYFSVHLVKRELNCAMAMPVKTRVIANCTVFVSIFLLNAFFWFIVSIHLHMEISSNWNATLSNFSIFLKSRWSALPTKIRLSNADENLPCWFRKLFKIICFHWFNFGNELNRFRMQLNYENRQVGNCWVNPITSGWGGFFSHQTTIDLNGFNLCFCLSKVKPLVN